jgi:hypothetical protein
MLSAALRQVASTGSLPSTAASQSSSGRWGSQSTSQLSAAAAQPGEDEPDLEGVLFDEQESAGR